MLRRVGETLYGAQWQSALARDLGISDRTMRRWAAQDEFVPPPGIARDILVLCHARQADLHDVIASLETLTEPHRPATSQRTKS